MLPSSLAINLPGLLALLYGRIALYIYIYPKVYLAVKAKIRFIAMIA